MTGLRAELVALIEGVRAGEVSEEDAVERLVELPYRDLGFARVDIHRELRQGAPEAVLAEGKTPDQVVAIARALHDGGAGSVLVTRADAPTRAAVRAALPQAAEHEASRCVWIARDVPEPVGVVVMASAGTSDGPVLHEARIRAGLLGAEVRIHEDVGVAGLHRLAAALPDLEQADCVVVVAGMDAALASVVGGARRRAGDRGADERGLRLGKGGETALQAMLCSCAAGLAVVGIDDGFGAGTIAARIARAAGSRAAQGASR